MLKLQSENMGIYFPLENLWWGSGSVYGIEIVAEYPFQGSQRSSSVCDEHGRSSSHTSV